MRLYYQSVLIFSLVLLLVSEALPAQQLSALHHQPSSTDTLLLRKFPYVSVSDSGQHCFWDFSRLSDDQSEPVSACYFIPFEEMKSTLGLHRENVNYYYRLNKDTLWLIGREMSFSKLNYPKPIPVLAYPFSYGDSLSGVFYGRGQYCHVQPLSSVGQYHVHADAIGQLLLPDMVIDTALRVHTHIHYEEDTSNRSCVHEDHYQWYSLYCRYPIFETTRLQIFTEVDTTTIASSYYYPQTIEKPHHSHSSMPTDEHIVDIDSVITDVSYMPNPVVTDLLINYQLYHAAEVFISLHHNGGVTSFQTTPHHEESGDHSIKINMLGLPIGSYVIYIHVNDMVVSGSIIKI